MLPPQKPGKSTCCNCGEEHSVKYCPKPNTEDGRLQVCFECDTIDHPWFKCEIYVPDIKEQYFRLWVCRMGLCCIVHEMSAHGLWHAFIVTEKARYKLKIAHERPGPLTPEFVLKMLDTSKHYVDILKQFDQGRVMPRDPDNESLSNNVVRIDKIVLDPATQQMTDDVVLQGTATGKDDVVKLTGARPVVDLTANDDTAMAGTNAVARQIQHPTKSILSSGANTSGRRQTVNKRRVRFVLGDEPLDTQLEATTPTVAPGWPSGN
ncbi:hypothetical protein SLS53_005470 [Cytospora paraplurivora]|uniref:Uncharacterized protein n=1 Tax=Cytospora paraplurivora TaxID=2898453 RepID=A0AAN9U4L5_9PEZI